MKITPWGPEAEGKIVYFISIDDQLRVHVMKKCNRSPVWNLRGEVKANDT